MRIEIDTSLTQLFAGTRLPTGSTCTHCDHLFDADDRCILHATRPEDASAYTLTGLSCPDCAHQTISSPTLGHSEHLLATRLTTTAHSNDEALILSDIHTIQTSPPSEGSAITQGPVALVPTVDLPELTNTTYHIECGDEQRTPLCNCSSDTDYTRVVFADLETPSARCCRTCFTVYQNEHETNSPDGDELSSLPQGPSHAQIDTSHSPTADSVITTQRAKRPATRTGVHAHSQSQE